MANFTRMFVKNVFRNKNVNPAITTNLLLTNINNKLKNVLDLESFNGKLKPKCRLQMVFSMRIYLEIIKFNLHQVCIPRWC